MKKVITFVLVATLVAASASLKDASVPQGAGETPKPVALRPSDSELFYRLPPGYEDTLKALTLQGVAITRMFLDTVMMIGEVKPLEELQAEGWLPFILTNPVTGAPMQNVCDRDSPGDYCLKIASPTQIEDFYFQDGIDPQFRSFKYEIPRRFHEKRFRYLFSSFGPPEHGYTAMDIKLVLLGEAVTWRVYDGAIARGAQGWDRPAIESLYWWPTRRLIDPRNRTILEFDGAGYGSLVKVDQIHPDLALIRVIEGNEIVYATTVETGKFVPPYLEDNPLAVVMRVWPWPPRGSDPLGRLQYGDLLRPYFSGYSFRAW